MTGYVLWSSAHWFLPLVSGVLFFFTTKAGFFKYKYRSGRETLKTLTERQQHHAHVNAMERALDIPESIWDDEDIAEPKPVAATGNEPPRERYRAPIPSSPPGYSASSTSYGYEPMAYSASCVSEIKPRASEYFNHTMWKDRVRSYGGQVTSCVTEMYTNNGWCLDTIDLHLGLDPRQAYEAVAELSRQAPKFGVIPRFTYGGGDYNGGLREMQRVHEDYWRMQAMTVMHSMGAVTTEQLRADWHGQFLSAFSVPPPMVGSDPGERRRY